MTYNKQSYDNVAHVKRLKDRGMRIPDEAEAIKVLGKIGYYRFSAYTLPFESGKLQDGTRNHTFSRVVDFDYILELYVFDHRLRRHVMSAIERIEVALRTRWGDEIALKGGPHAYMESVHFQDVLKHAEDLVKVAQEIKKSKEAFSSTISPVTETRPCLRLGYRRDFFLGASFPLVPEFKETNIKRGIMRHFGMPTV